MYPREENLRLDTATVFLGSEIVSYSGPNMTVNLDMATFNGLTPQSTYTTNLFSNSASPVSGYDLDFSVVSTEAGTGSPTTNYTNVLAFNLHDRQWFTDHLMGYYVRRYLEQIENNNAANAGMITIDPLQTPIMETWFAQNPDSILNNDWEYTVDNMYTQMDVIENYSVSSTNSNGANVGNAFQRIVNETIADGAVNTERAITIFTGYDFHSGTFTDAGVNPVIDYLNANDFQVNFIGSEFSDWMVAYACETGGFLCENENYVTPLTEAQLAEPVQDIAVYMQNMHRLMLHDYPVHRCQVQITKTTGDFVVGERVTLSFDYGPKTYRFSVRPI